MGKVWKIFKAFILYPALIVLAPLILIFILYVLTDVWAYITATPEEAAGVAHSELIRYAIDEGFPSGDYGEPHLICQDDEYKRYAFQFKHHRQNKFVAVDVYYGLLRHANVGESEGPSEGPQWCWDIRHGKR